MKKKLCIAGALAAGLVGFGAGSAQALKVTDNVEVTNAPAPVPPISDHNTVDTDGIHPGGLVTVCVTPRSLGSGRACLTV